jgi:2-polyprenyl-6-methoxyphenol hydroxylase-like FAD-dependent oxidoreductase
MQNVYGRFKHHLGKVPMRSTLPAEVAKRSLRPFTPEVRVNAKVVDLIPHDGVKGGVHVLLSDGSSEWGDVVVGADGVRSTIRKLLYPDQQIAVTCQSLGITTFEGFVTCPETLPWIGEGQFERWGTARTIRITSLHAQGVQRVAFTATLYETPQELLDVESGDESTVLALYKNILMREFRSFGSDIVDLLNVAVQIVRCKHLEVPILRRWFNRRAVLIGDAAHGALPCALDQDVGLCVEDAAILSTALMDVPLMNDDGFEYAFRTYESVRQDRVHKYVRWGRQVRALAATHRVGLRNAVLRITPGVAVHAAQRWLTDWSYSAQLLDIDMKSKIDHKAYRF